MVFKFQRAGIVIFFFWFIIILPVPNTIYATIWGFSVCMFSNNNRFSYCLFKVLTLRFRIEWKFIPDAEVSELSYNFLSSFFTLHLVSSNIFLQLLGVEKLQSSMKGVIFLLFQTSYLFQCPV